MDKWKPLPEACMTPSPLFCGVRSLNRRMYFNLIYSFYESFLLPLPQPVALHSLKLSSKRQLVLVANNTIRFFFPFLFFLQLGSILVRSLGFDSDTVIFNVSELECRKPTLQ